MTNDYKDISVNSPWQQHLPMEVRAWAVVTIRAEVERRGDEYADNYRCAEAGCGNLQQEALFSEIEEAGCCGSHRFEALAPDGKTYVLGYNYGH